MSPAGNKTQKERGRLAGIDVASWQSLKRSEQHAQGPKDMPLQSPPIAYVGMRCPAAVSIRFFIRLQGIKSSLFFAFVFLEPGNTAAGASLSGPSCMWAEMKIVFGWIFFLQVETHASWTRHAAVHAFPSHYL
jgi:hypothetical protein